MEGTVRGEGAPLLLVHGSAADHLTWSIQLRSLADRFRMLAIERREGVTRVEGHAGDCARLVEREAGAPVLAVGSSFGGVVVLDLCRRRPDLIRGAVLMEPPLPPADLVPAVPNGFGCAYDRLVATRGGEAAAELFLRTVLTDEAYERIPRRFQERALSRWRQIRNDSLALAAFEIGYHRLAADVAAPVLLLGGERSPPFYRPTLEALHRALPGSRLAILRGAGHMMHADAHRQFHDELLRFHARLGSR